MLQRMMNCHFARVHSSLTLSNTMVDGEFVLIFLELVCRLKLIRTLTFLS